mgnify:FL=1
MSKKYSSDNKMQKLFEGFRKSVLEEGSYEDEIMKGEEEMERHMARKAAMKRSRPSSAPAGGSSEYAPRPDVDMVALMKSVQDQIAAKGGNVKVKITDKETGEVTEF